jgi:transcriptional regulator with XRE-family HTH domain
MANPAAALVMTRRQAGLTQAQLAELASTSQATISAYECGRKEPSLRTFARLLGLMGARLAVTPTPTPLREPSRSELARSAKSLEMVIELAEALPARSSPTLSFPRLLSLAA